MDTRSFVIQRQIHWAKQHGITLVPAKFSQVESATDHVVYRGIHAYTADLQSNLYEPLSDRTRKCFEAGDGKELAIKMRAVHSSSAVGVNFFHYWLERGLLSDLAKALEIPSTNITTGEFECKRPVMSDVDRASFPYDPNLDFAFLYEKGKTLEVIVECKFTEPFGPAHGGLSAAYLRRDDLWADIPKLRRLGEQISPNDGRFRYLHVAQLLKHTLGLLQSLRAAGSKRNARLVYLFYDVTGKEGYDHLVEVGEFAALVREQFPNRSPVIFQYMTYQDALMRLAMKYRDRHPAYLDWMLERYL